MREFISEYLRDILTKQFLTEGNTNRESCISKYGERLFGGQFGGEDNTPLEDKIIELLGSFTNSSYGRNLDPELVDSLKGLSVCMDAYPSILKPNVNKVYRASSMKLKDIIKLNMNNDLVINNYKYTPSSMISSWTTDLEETKPFGKISYSMMKHWFPRKLSSQFSSEQISRFNLPSLDKNQLLEENMKVVYSCNVDNSFLFNSKSFSKLSYMKNNDESEILKITNTSISVDVIVGGLDDNMSKEEIIKLIMFLRN